MPKSSNSPGRIGRRPAWNCGGGLKVARGGRTPQWHIPKPLHYDSIQYRMFLLVSTQGPRCKGVTQLKSQQTNNLRRGFYTTVHYSSSPSYTPCVWYMFNFEVRPEGEGIPNKAYYRSWALLHQSLFRQIPEKSPSACKIQSERL